MNVFIEYFYGIKVDKIINHNTYYSFEYKGFLYKLYIFDPVYNDLNILIDLNDKFVENTLISKIIHNKTGELISIYNGIKYILLKIYVNIHKQITLEEISFLSNYSVTNNIKVNWGLLWSKKIDYLEEVIYENGRKFPLIVDSFNYFVGLAENAITYYNSISFDINENNYSISHKKIKINDTIEELYNPLNIIFDYRVRDIAEYIKISFFNGNKNIFSEISFYLNNNSLSIIDVKLLISRILYPSFYFDMYEDILINDKDESIILEIISNLSAYEKYLSDIILFFNKFYAIDKIAWLK